MRMVSNQTSMKISLSLLSTVLDRYDLDVVIQEQDACNSRPNMLGQFYSGYSDSETNTGNLRVRVTDNGRRDAYLVVTGI